MRTTRRATAALAALITGAVVAAPGMAVAAPPRRPAGTPTAAATCAGATTTVTWSPPADTSGLSGYEVDQQVTNDGSDGATVAVIDAPLGATSVTATLQAGTDDFLVWGVTPSGALVGPYGSDQVVAGTAPDPDLWVQSTSPSLDSVGNGTATVTFAPAGPIQPGTTGYIGDAVTVSGAGRTVAVTPAADGDATVTFTGLRNGRPVTFTSTAFNACGTATATSAAYVPAGPHGRP